MTDDFVPPRVFKTAWFTKAAARVRIGDDELCTAIAEVMNGQADDLGGGVVKKRLNRNWHRSLVLAKGGRNWIYAYLFAKKERANIDTSELEDFRLLAKSYAAMSPQQLRQLIEYKDLLEICHGAKASLQK